MESSQKRILKRFLWFLLGILFGAVGALMIGADSKFGWIVLLFGLVIFFAIWVLREPEDDPYSGVEIKIYHSLGLISLLFIVPVALGLMMISAKSNEEIDDWIFVVFFGLIASSAVYLFVNERIRQHPYILITDKYVELYRHFRKNLRVNFADVTNFRLLEVPIPRGGTLYCIKTTYMHNGKEIGIDAGYLTIKPWHLCTILNEKHLNCLKKVNSRNHKCQEDEALGKEL